MARHENKIGDQARFPDESIRVLLVEDEESSATAVSNMLTRRSMTVTVDYCAEDAECRELGDFDIVVSDVKLPARSGVDLLKSIRAKSDDFPVVLITGYNDLATAVDGLRYGAQDYVQKPLDNVESLIIPIRRAVEQYRLVIQNRELQDSLDQSNEQLKVALDELKRTQQMVIQRERLKALGQMVSERQPLAS